MLHWIWVLIVGGVIGLIAGALTGHGTFEIIKVMLN